MEKKVSKLGLLTMSIGGMIGWGAFMQPGLKILPSAGLLNSVIAMFLGLIMVATVASCYGIVLNRAPNSPGGEYSYSKLAFTRTHSFVVGWFLIIVLVIFTAAVFLVDIPNSPLPDYARRENIHFAGIVSILVITPWAYYGVSNIPKVAGDAKLPYGKVIKITVLSLVCGYCIYMMLLVLTASMYGQEALKGYAGWATGDAVRRLLGTPGLLLLTAALSFAIFSGVNSFYMGATRVMAGMSEDGLLSKRFSLKHPRFGTPYQAVIFVLLVVVAAPFFGRQVLKWIVDMSALGGAVVFLYTALTAFKISAGLEKAVGLIASVFSGVFILLLVLPFSPGFLSVQSIAALVVWSILGVVLYRLNTKKLKVE